MTRLRPLMHSPRMMLAAAVASAIATVAGTIYGVISGANIAIGSAYYDDISARVAWRSRHGLLYDRILWGTTTWSDRPNGFYRAPQNVIIISRALPHWSIWYTPQADELRMNAWGGAEVGVGFPLRHLTGHSIHEKTGNSVEVGIIHLRFRGSDIEIPTRLRYGRLLTNVVFLTILCYILLFSLSILTVTNRARRGKCTRCGYKLLGLTSGHCPECGEHITHQLQANTSSIRTWLYRRPRRRRRDL